MNGLRALYHVAYRHFRRTAVPVNIRLAVYDADHSCRAVLDRLNTGIVGWNSTRAVDICLVQAEGLAMVRSPVQGVLWNRSGDLIRKGEDDDVVLLGYDAMQIRR
jgi:hypothetical protein